MSSARLLLDTYYVQALLNPRDPDNERTAALLPQVRRAAEVVITEAVFAEVGNALSGAPRLRQLAAAFVRRCRTEANMVVVSVDTALLTRAVELYESRADKEWGLIDCISVVVMRDRDLVAAATYSRQPGGAACRANPGSLKTRDRGRLIETKRSTREVRSLASTKIGVNLAHQHCAGDRPAGDLHRRWKMTRSILGRAAFSTAVVLALGFGLQEAVASSPAVSSAEARRPYCEDQADCELTCEAKYGPGTPGFCSSGHTCYCYP